MKQTFTTREFHIWYEDEPKQIKRVARRQYLLSRDMEVILLQKLADKRPLTQAEQVRLREIWNNKYSLKEKN